MPEMIEKRFGAVIYRFAVRPPDCKTPKKKCYGRTPSKCFYCGEQMNYIPGDPLHQTVDHVIPLSRGGSNFWQNKVWACSDCNYIKGDMTLEEFRAELARMAGQPTWLFYREEFPVHKGRNKFRSFEAVRGERAS